MTKEIEQKIKRMLALNMSVRAISQALGIPKTTVHRWIKKVILNGVSAKGLYHNLKLSNPELISYIRELLTFHTEEKGESRVLYVSQVYRILRPKLFSYYPKINREFFKEFLEYFIKQEFKTKYKLEQKRRSKKELCKYKPSKGSLERELACWEVDATGYTYNGVQYSILQAVDRFTGFAFPPFIVTNKEKKATYYNKAFTSLDVTEYLKKLIQAFGKPKRIITDNEAILTAEILKQALTEIGVEIRRTIPANPQQKLIERIFREIKQNVREVLASERVESIKDLWDKATYLYNTRPHKTKHLGKIVPADLVKKVGLSVGECSDEEVELAFTERFERVWQNGSIRVDNMIYEFSLSHDRPITVFCRRPLDNLEKLFVFDGETGAFLGIAKLVTKPLASYHTREEKQAKQLLKRVEKGLRKLEEEKEELAKLKVKLKPEEKEESLAIEILSSREIEMVEKKALEEKDLELDFLKLWGGGEEDENACVFDLKKVH